MNVDTPILAWHFVGDTLRDGRPVPADGKTLVHRGEIILCQSGLHASIRIIDALRYAPGNTLCRVACWGQVEFADDKLDASRRKILWRIDASGLLRDFARKCALDVAHLWEMPDVVREYLTTGREDLRAAVSAVAWDASRDAAWAAVRAAAMAAARAAARAAAWNAAWDAAWDAARAAAEAVAWDASRDAAWAAVRAAAMAAARAAARAAAWNAAWDAAWDAARAAAEEAQNARLEQMVMEARRTDAEKSGD